MITDEVHSARSRLSGALSTAERIVDKYAGDDFPVSPLKRFQSLDSPFPSPTKSPRGIRRRRKKPMPLNTAFHHTFVMKLFDRSVDLAQFADNTSLYPVCRAWMKNDPHNTSMAPRLRTPTPEPNENPDQDSNKDDQANEDSDNAEKEPPQAINTETEAENSEPDVYKLPPPAPLEVGQDGKLIAIRNPIIAKQDITKDFTVKDNPEAPNADELLRSHMNRWQEIRTCWKMAALSNEKRYSQSMNILTAMYEK